MSPSRCRLCSSCFAAVLVAILVLSPVSVAHATKYWKDGVVSGNWSTGNNWSSISTSDTTTSGVPTLSEAVNIVHIDGTARTVTYDVNAPSLGLLSIDLTGAGTTTNTLLIPSNNSLSANSIWVGGYSGSGATAGRGAVNQTAGTVATTSGSDFVVGYGAGSKGTYTLSGTGAFTAAQSEFIGFGGTGTLNHSSGTNTIAAGAIGGFDVGTLATGNGTYNLSGSGALVANKSEYIGDSGTGFFNQTGGTNTIVGAGRHLYIGNNSTGLGTYLLSAGMLSIGGDEYVGVSATGNGPQSGGRFIQTGGSSTIAGNLTIGVNSGATGSYTLGGSGVLITNNAVIGGSGTGTLSIQDQALMSISNNLAINSLSTVNFNGGILEFATATGLNRLIFNAGTIKLSSERFIGSDPAISILFGASPTIPSGKGLTVNGTTRIQTNLAVSGGKFIGLSDVQLGIAGSSPVSLTVTNGGTAFANSEVSVGSSEVATASGAINVDGPGSALQNPGNIFLGQVSTGLLQITGGGLVTTGGNATIGSTGINGQGIATVNGPGSTWTIAGGLNLTGVSTGRGTLNIENQGLVQVGGPLAIAADNAVNLNGGTLGLNTSTGPSLSRINYSSGKIQLAGDRAIGSDAIVQVLFGEAPTIPAGKALTVQGTATLQTPVTLNGGSFSASQVINPQLVQVEHGTFDVTNQAGTIGAGQILDLAADATINYGLGITNQGLIKGDGQLGGAFQNAATGELRAEAEKSLNLTGIGNTSAGLINLQGGTLEFDHDLTVGGTIIADSGTLDVESLLTLVLSEIQADNNAVIKSQIAKIKGNIAAKGKLKFLSPNKVELSGITDVEHGTLEADHGFRFGTDEMVSAANDMKAALAPAQEQYRLIQDDLAQTVEQLRQSNQLGDDAQLANVDLQNKLQQRQQIFQSITNLIALIHCVECPSVIANMKSTVNADAEFLGKLVAGGPAGLSTVDVNGDLTFAPDSVLELDLAGTAAGQFDKVAVNGDAIIDIGTTIKLSLLDPNNPQSGMSLFQPQVGDYFDVLTANTIDAEFLLVEPPPQSLLNFVAGVFDSGSGQVLRITAAPVPVALPGDFNNDDAVDAADYVVWRKNNGTTAAMPNDSSPGLVNTADYNTWRAHFDQTFSFTGSGSGAAASAAPQSATIPEPATLVMLTYVTAGWCLRRRRVA